MMSLLASYAAELMAWIPPTATVSSDENSGSALLLLSGPIAGGATYWLLYRYYRNVDKTHKFEHETLIEAQPISGTDVKIKEIRGTSQSRIPGENHKKHRTRVRRLP